MSPTVSSQHSLTNSLFTTACAGSGARAVAGAVVEAEAVVGAVVAVLLSARSEADGTESAPTAAAVAAAASAASFGAAAVGRRHLLRYSL